MVLVVDQWRAYLQFSEFIIKTDQKRLVHLEEQRLHTPWQQKAFTKLLGLQYCICYRKGSENSAADALSRLPINSSQQVNAVSVCQPSWFQEVTQGYVHDPKAQQLITQLALASVAGGSSPINREFSVFEEVFGWGTMSRCRPKLCVPCMTVRSATIPNFSQLAAESSSFSRGRA